MNEADTDKRAEGFCRIAGLNALKFVKLLETLESHEGEMISTIRVRPRYQRDAMSHRLDRRKVSPAENDQSVLP